MAGLDWFELEIDFPNHRKSRALAALLRDPNAIAYMVRLFSHCYHFAVDVLGPSEVASQIAEEVAEWRGEPGAFVSAAVRSGYLVECAEGLRVHGVAERLGPHLKKRRRDQKRQKDRRADLAASRRRPRDAAETSEVHPGEVSGDKYKDKDKKEASPPRASARAGVSQGVVSGAVEAASPPPAAEAAPEAASAEQVARETARAIGAEHRLRAIADADLDARYPATGRLLAWLRDHGAPLEYPAKSSGRAAAEAACQREPLEVAGPRVLAAYQANPRTGLGWYLHDLAPELDRRRPTAATDIRLGITAPGRAEAFGEGGDRAIE